MKRKYPYYRITCHIFDGQPLTYNACITYVESMQFIKKGIPGAIIFFKEKYAVWVWGDELCTANMNNSEKLYGEIALEWNGFKELYDKFNS